MPNQLWGIGAHGIVIHFQCTLCGQEIECRQNFTDASPVLQRPRLPSGWIRLMDEWYCDKHPSEDITALVMAEFAR